MPAPEHPRQPGEHWILRLAPARHRARVERLAFIFGMACTFVWELAAMVGLFFAPLLFAIWRPEAPLSQPVVWLMTTVRDKDTRLLIYTAVMGVVIAILFTGHMFAWQHRPTKPPEGGADEGGVP